MTDKRVVVPEGMLEAVVDAWDIHAETIVDQCDNIAQAVLLYQREHPPVPTDEQAAEILNKAYADTAGSLAPFQWAAREWIRRMYDAPDPPFDPSLGGCLTGRTFTQKEADLIKEYIQRSVPLGMVR